jgi:DNA-3-methyladenine glycosylase I
LTNKCLNFDHKNRAQTMQTIPGPDGKPRCSWCAAAPEFFAYHDHEWGFPVDSDVRLFEKLSLEAFQSGLSWRTILAKREHFRTAFAQFDFHQVARYTEPDVVRLLMNDGIIRHRGKIEAVINNAKRALELVQTEGSLAAYLWRYEPRTQATPEAERPSITAESVALAQDLKRRGWKFVGPTTVYAFMQAMGLVNDHAADCVIRPKVEAAKQRWRQQRNS